ncbi:MAG: DUF4340 domain-containing protein [Acidiferrobacteraceae bacterium]
MKNRWLLNLALVLFIAALLLWVHFRPPGGRHHPPRPPLTRLALDQITSIRLVRPGRRTVVLAKQGNHWRITAPVSARADRFRIDSLLHVAKARVEDRFAATGTLAKYGLQKPNATLWLDGARIEFGSGNALGGLQYVRYGGQVALIPAESFSPSSLRLNNLYSSRLIEKDRRPVGFVFPDFTLTSQHGAWKVRPPQPHLSTDAINSFVDEWRYARALSVNRYHDKPVTGRVLVTYVPGNAKPSGSAHVMTIDILERKPELVLYRPDEGLDYHFPAQMGRHLLNLSASP